MASTQLTVLNHLKLLALMCKYAYTNAISDLASANSAVIEELEQQIVNGSSTVFAAKATFLTDNWTEQEDGRYTQTITVDGILETDEPLIDLCVEGLSADEEDEVGSAWASLVKIETSANALTAHFCDLPEVDVPIKIKEVR